jgi:uncharacterized protein with HEPN domain
MDERILKWLFDIKFAIDEIDSYFENEERNFFEYRRNTMLKRAVERELEIIGEAVNRIVSRDTIFLEKIQMQKQLLDCETKSFIHTITSQTRIFGQFSQIIFLS